MTVDFGVMPYPRGQVHSPQTKPPDCGHRHGTVNGKGICLNNSASCTVVFIWTPPRLSATNSALSPLPF